MSDSYENKPINNWTCEELQKWVIKIKLGNKNQKIVLNEIKQQTLKGTIFNSIKNASDIMNLFPNINKMSANKMCAALKEVKQNNNPNDADEQKSFATKHIDSWTCDELQAWIINLKLENKYQNSITDTIKEQSITGEDFNSIQNSSDMMNSFPKMAWHVSVKIYKELQTIREHSATIDATENENIHNTEDTVEELRTENIQLNRIIEEQTQTIQTLRAKVAEMEKTIHALTKQPLPVSPIPPMPNNTNMLPSTNVNNPSSNYGGYTQNNPYAFPHPMTQIRQQNQLPQQRVSMPPIGQNIHVSQQKQNVTPTPNNQNHYGQRMVYNQSNNINNYNRNNRSRSSGGYSNAHNVYGQNIYNNSLQSQAPMTDILSSLNNTNLTYSSSSD